MKLSKISTALTLSTALAMSAHAAPINLVQNGDFSDVGGITDPTQFGSRNNNGYVASDFIANWTGNEGYEIWYPDAASATSVNATSEWGETSTKNTNKEMLWAIAPAPNGTNTFVGLDGDQTSGVQSSISQTIGDLTIGQQYTLTFDWGAAQMQSRDGDTQEYLAVTFGSDTQDTSTIDNPSHSFTGWQSETMTFTATAASQTLTFLSVGTPSGLPPMALLTNVSMVANVPEPSVMMLFGTGLIGLAFISRRRTVTLE
ncbi:PEP-CTERM sorting domain-containing protein [Candidatus Nitrosacidococcus tergens]|uniref:Ice-binding protein C-terminal domain-containing protein n=1 Tax=Candidatus Nitrosacidococcus tergens TaxID=553981 RepID=A0A7G1Q8K9_9GAMM|nr:PEP-CTERM sorting domain-containing protein [Candidatus Nitrosacidococcus tergens]CAB1275301.1 conserved exported protein of unknown function [Candidatus Nitrosacidococcus tergens]